MTNNFPTPGSIVYILPKVCNISDKIHPGYHLVVGVNSESLPSKAIFENVVYDKNCNYIIDSLWRILINRGFVIVLDNGPRI